MPEKKLSRYEQGLCANCSEPRLPDNSRCEKHRNEFNEYCRQRRAKNKVEHGTTQPGFDSKAHYRKRYAAAKKAGVCFRHPDRPVCADSGTYCQECLDKQRADQKQRAAEKAKNKRKTAREKKRERREAEVCEGCGGEHGEVFKAGTCRRCYALKLEREKGLTRYESRKAAGLCQSCDNVATDTMRCDACRAKRKMNRDVRVSSRACADCGEPNDRVGKKTCSECSKKKIALYNERKAAGLCPHCGSDKPVAPGKHCSRCQSVNKKKDKVKTAKLRAEVLAAYGGKCQCPGCSQTHPDFLHVDHVGNDGAKHRRELSSGKRYSGHRFYTWLRKHGFPKKGFQLLCANCNTAKHRCGGQCPLAGQPH